MEAFEKKSETEKLPDIENIEEANEVIFEAFERGERPVISVPEEYIVEARNGIKPHTTWVGEKIIAGTFLRSPYLPEGEKRHVLQVNISPEQVEPRFTGPDKHFHGVVGFRGPISAEAIEEIKT